MCSTQEEGRHARQAAICTAISSPLDTAGSQTDQTAALAAAARTSMAGMQGPSNTSVLPNAADTCLLASMDPPGRQGAFVGTAGKLARPSMSLDAALPVLRSHHSAAYARSSSSLLTGSLGSVAQVTQALFRRAESKAWLRTSPTLQRWNTLICKVQAEQAQQGVGALQAQQPQGPKLQRRSARARQLRELLEQ